MNIIDETFEPKEKSKKSNPKNIAKIILIFIVILIVAIIAILGAIAYIQNKQLKLYINGTENEKVKDMMVVESDGTVYFPIRDIASYLEYESFSGEYVEKSENASKCYIQNKNEVANFSLNSNKIYKLDLADNSENYEYFYAKKPVKAINGKLYATTDAIEKAFNVSFTYNTDKQRAYFYTMPYLVQSYSKKVLDYGYEEIDSKFVNQKAILSDMIVVSKNGKKSYGVIDAYGNSIIEPKYDSIEFLPYYNYFLVTSNGKVGVISSNKDMKIQILYDELKLIDSDSGLFIAKKDNKYGVIDTNGNIKVYIEYDQIGIDNTKFTQNGIKNGYLLDNGMIPVRKDKLWGAFDKNGKQILQFKYDSFGYIASSNKDAINLLIIPDYNVMVAEINKKYLLIQPNGEEQTVAVLDDVYMTISGGKKYYYMNYNNQKVDVTEYLDQYGVNQTSSKNTSSSNNSSSENTEEENDISSDTQSGQEQQTTQQSQSEQTSQETQGSSSNQEIIEVQE